MTNAAPMLANDFTDSTRANGYDYKIAGAFGQYVALRLDPGKSIMAERGRLTARAHDIELGITAGGGAKGVFGKMMNMIGRKITEEDILLATLTNKADQPRVALLSAPIMGQVAAINTAAAGGEFVCLKEAFIAGDDITVSAAFTRSVKAMALGGREFVMQKISGSGTAFIGAHGSISEIPLEADQSFVVNQGALLAHSKDVKIGAALAGGPVALMLGGEGTFELKCTGPGRVWIVCNPGFAVNQSAPSP